jgi:hypothetical protein
LDKCGSSLIEVTSRHFPGGTEEYHERHYQNANQDGVHYYTNLLLVSQEGNVCVEGYYCRLRRYAMQSNT